MEENKNNQTSESTPVQQKGPDVSSTLTEPQPQISPNVSDIPSTLKNNVTKKLMLIGFVFSIIVLTVSGLYFYLHKQRFNPETQESSQDAQETPSPTPDPTSDWKTYSNENLGISFKYPADYSVSQKNGSITLNSPSYLCREKQNPEGFIDPSRSPNFEPTSEVYVTITSKEGGSYSEIWFDSFGFRFSRDELEEYLINGKTSYYFTQGAEMSFSRTAYLVEVNDNKSLQIEVFLPIYQFECENPNYEFSQDPRYQKVANQILSTFKFNEGGGSKLKICPDGWYNIHSCMSENCSTGEHFLIEVNGKLEQKDSSDYDLEWIRNNCEINSPADIG